MPSSSHSVSFIVTSSINITFNPTNTDMPCISDKFLNDDAKEGASGLSEDLGSEEGSLHALNKLILQK